MWENRQAGQPTTIGLKQKLGTELRALQSIVHRSGSGMWRTIGYPLGVNKNLDKGAGLVVGSDYDSYMLPSLNA
jgi:hypothetical protein